MLKGKKGIYILLPIVVFVWGAILYQVLDAFSDDDPVIASNAMVSFSKIQTKERDVFTIGEIERDPFLGTIYRPKKVVTAPKKISVKKDTLIWPSVRYKGLVTGDNSSNAIYLVEINGSDQLMKLNESFAEVKLIKGSSSAIRLRYKRKTKQFEILN